MIVVEVVGWAGALALLAAYALLATRRIEATSRTYRALNLLGAAALATNAVAHVAWPSAALNAVWLAISIHAARTSRRQAR